MPTRSIHEKPTCCHLRKLLLHLSDRLLSFACVKTLRITFDAYLRFQMKVSEL